MGLGLINAAYQARFNRYLTDRGIANTAEARVWCFAGDGEMDEPESLAGVALAGREHLDNLIFVVNCNLQRLDGPVRGNAKIVQELEGLFRGAGWNVIKLLWGREWDPLLAADTNRLLVDKMNATVDGQFQKYRVETGGYIRDHFFGPDARLRQLVAHLSDDELRRLRRGGHDSAKVYAAYRAACHHRGAPTVILAQTVKGWALGPDVEARNATHQIKKMTEAELRTFRDRLELPITDAALDRGPAAVRPPRLRLPRVRVPDGTPAAPRGHLPARHVAPQDDDAAWTRTRTGSCWPAPERRSPLRPPARSPGCCATCCAIPALGRGSCRSSRTRPAPSASTRSFASTRSTHRTASSTNPSTPISCSATRKHRRSDPRGRHHRGRLHGELHGRGHRLRHLGRAHGPLLHLLLDVRLPSFRRPALGRR